MKSYVTAVVATAALFFGATANAGFGDLKKLGSDAADDTSSVSEEALVQKFTSTLHTVLQGQAELRLAFADKEGAAQLTAAAEQLTSGSTVDKDVIEKALAISSEAAASSQEKMDAAAELTEEGREHYLKGLLLSAQGAAETKGMTKEASEFATSAQQQISSASMMQKAKVTKKLAAGMYVANQLPGFSAAMVENVSRLVTFAQSMDMDVPEDATSFMAAF